MLNASELDGPAHLLHRSPPREGDTGHDWSTAREFTSLREAIHAAMTEDVPAGEVAYIRTSSGTVLDPETLQALFDSLQGP